MKLSKLSRISALLPLVLLCGADIHSAQPRLLDGVMHLPMTAIPEDPSSIPETPALFLVTTLAQYQQLFGEDAVAVDFNRDWVFLYSAGLEPTGGYEAVVSDLAYTPDVQSLVITTTLESPGMNCAVPQIVTKPYSVVKFPRPAKVGVVRLNPEYEVVDCQGN
jgi:hypothetical protein